jgi:hypothetical protein
MNLQDRLAQVSLGHQTGEFALDVFGIHHNVLALELVNVVAEVLHDLFYDCVQSSRADIFNGLIHFVSDASNFLNAVFRETTDPH